jgi:hypothetical protein
VPSIKSSSREAARACLPENGAAMHDRRALALVERI